MSALDQIVSVEITTQGAGLTADGFGTALIMSYRARLIAGVDKVRSYSSLSEMALDGYTATTPEYLMAQKYFAQNPRPDVIKVGKGTLPPTQRYDITVVSVQNSTDYTVLYDGVEVTYTSDASATNDEIATGLAAALDTAMAASHGAATSGSGGSLICRVTADAAGGWASIEVQNIGLLKITQNNAATTVATDLDAFLDEDSDWYCVLNPWGSEAQIAAVAAWVESNEKTYSACSGDTEILTVTSGSATDVAKDLITAAYTRTIIHYHPSPIDFIDAGFAGKILPKDPGTETGALKTLAGVDAYTVSTTQLTNAEAKNCNTYTTLAGRNVTRWGKVASGEWFDVIRFNDWMKVRMQTRIASLLFNADKIPYTDAGIAQVVGQVRGQILDGIEVGGISDDEGEEFSITYPRASEVSSEDKAARILPDVEYSYTLAGAIHKTVVRGTVSA
jgi:hypothetical protein